MSVSTESVEPAANDVAAVARCEQMYNRLRDELAKTIVGQDEVIEQTLTALFAGGHALLEGVPGLAKTLLVNSLAKALHLSFKRSQRRQKHGTCVGSAHQRVAMGLTSRFSAPTNS